MSEYGTGASSGYGESYHVVYYILLCLTLSLDDDTKLHCFGARKVIGHLALIIGFEYRITRLS